MDRFRANIVIDSTDATTDVDPFAEDGWKRIRIGNVEIRIITRVPRCIIPTVDQNTGAAAYRTAIKAGDTHLRKYAEPLATLKKIRADKDSKLSAFGSLPIESGGTGGKDELSPFFGVYCGMQHSFEQGTIHVGDTIVLLE